MSRPSESSPCPKQLVLWAFRKRLEGARGLPGLQHAFWLACGLVHVEAALGAFEDLFSVLARHGRRCLGFHRPRCCAVSADERSLLALIGSYQAGHLEHAAALTRWLVPPHAAGELTRAAALLADILKECDQVLPAPGPEGGRRSRADVH